MDEDLKSIIEKQEQLMAMRASVQDFSEKLNKEQGDFLRKHLGYKDDETTLNVYDLIKRVTEKK